MPLGAATRNLCIASRFSVLAQVPKPRKKSIENFWSDNQDDQRRIIIGKNYLHKRAYCLSNDKIHEQGLNMCTQR